ncbi:MAG: Hpt domain-containing protein [Rhodospirillales bacterium]|nr:Hpt domain-containing protein [Rhodospirillales bacterium]
MKDNNTELAERLEELKKSYVSQLDERISALESAWEIAVHSATQTERVDGVRKLNELSHKLAGSAGTFGFSELSKVASKIESHSENLAENIEYLDEARAGELSGLIAECRKLAA